MERVDRKVSFIYLYSFADRGLSSNKLLSFFWFLFKARDKLTKKRHTKKLKKLSKSDAKEESESDASTDDLPLSSIKAGTATQGNTCVCVFRNKYIILNFICTGIFASTRLV